MTEDELRIQMERHHRAGYGWALNCCFQNPDEAEDVLQTVYLKILDGRARFDGRSEFKTWFFAVIRKTAADARRKSILRQLNLERYKQHFAENEVAVSEAAQPSELLPKFRRLLTALPKRQREVLHLVFSYEFTLQQVAEVMRISVGAVRTHYDRGKKRIRQLMEEREVLNE